MSTEIIRERPLSHRLGETTINWIRVAQENLLGRKKQLIIGVAGFAVVAAAAFYFWGGQTSAAQYLTATVERGNLRNTVTATGTLQAVTTVQVGSQASGTISSLSADYNSIVKKGQVIAQLDPAVSKAQVDQARAGLQQARAAVTNSRAGVSDAQARAQAAVSTTQNNQAGVAGARANLAVLKAQQDDALSYLKQQESLLKSSVVPQRDLDVAQTAYQTAQAKYDQGTAQLNQAIVNEQMAAGSGVAQSQAQVQQSQAEVQQSQAQ